MYSKMIITNDQVINGKIDHIDIGDETVIDCSNCPDLTELKLIVLIVQI
jgi:hypothetical protein